MDFNTLELNKKLIKAVRSTNSVQALTTAQEVINSGADVNYIDNSKIYIDYLKGIRKNLTPLMHAVKDKDIELCQLLLRNGADIDPGNIIGSTPLTLAIKEYRYFNIKNIIEQYRTINKISTVSLHRCALSIATVATTIHFLSGILSTPYIFRFIKSGNNIKASVVAAAPIVNILMNIRNSINIAHSLYEIGTDITQGYLDDMLQLIASKITFDDEQKSALLNNKKSFVGLFQGIRNDYFTKNEINNLQEQKEVLLQLFEVMVNIYPSLSAKRDVSKDDINRSEKARRLYLQKFNEYQQEATRYENDLLKGLPKHLKSFFDNSKMMQDLPLEKLEIRDKIITRNAKENKNYTVMPLNKLPELPIEVWGKVSNYISDDANDLQLLIDLVEETIPSTALQEVGSGYIAPSSRFKCSML